MFYYANPSKIYLSTAVAPVTTQNTFQSIKSGGTLYLPTGYSRYDTGGWTYLINTKKWQIIAESADLE